MLSTFQIRRMVFYCVLITAEKISILFVAHSLSNYNCNSSKGLVRPSKSDCALYIQCLFFTVYIFGIIPLLVETGTVQARISVLFDNTVHRKWHKFIMF